jgi:hypothetical protein
LAAEQGRGEKETTNHANNTNEGAAMEVVYNEESYAIMGTCFEFKATGTRLGLLVNFGHFPKLEYERIVR